MWRREALSATVILVAVGCAAHRWYARVPVEERSVNLVTVSLHKGMELTEVVRTMVEVRGVRQDASLTFDCRAGRVEILLHAGEELAHLRSTRVYASGFASIWRQDFRLRSLKTQGFDRQGAFLRAVDSRKEALVLCEQATLAFNAVPEGGCGYDRLPISFGSDGKVRAIGPAQETTCEP